MNVLYEDVKSLPITEYLAFKGILPCSKINNEVYYLCPYRPETRASLSVNLDKNVWYDFGDHVGGSIIDLALKIFCGDRVKANDELAQFVSYTRSDLYAQRRSLSIEPQNETLQDRIRIINYREISHPALTQLIESRGIPAEVAKVYCKEVWFDSKDGRRCFAIGLPNIVNGWELRGLNTFKCSTQPKAVSLIKTGKNNFRVSVFEGLFDMLSYAAYCYLNNKTQPSCDLICLNSLSLLKSAYSLFRDYKEIDLYLDSDTPGRKATEEIIHSHTNAKDKSKLYSCLQNCKDLNEWFILYLQDREF